jgi:hypothetical protein
MEDALDLSHWAVSEVKRRACPQAPPALRSLPWGGARVGSHRCPILRPGNQEFSTRSNEDNLKTPGA